MKQLSNTFSFVESFHFLGSGAIRPVEAEIKAGLTLSKPSDNLTQTRTFSIHKDAGSKNFGGSPYRGQHRHSQQCYRQENFAHPNIKTGGQAQYHYHWRQRGHKRQHPRERSTRVLDKLEPSYQWQYKDHHNGHHQALSFLDSVAD